MQNSELVVLGWAVV